MVLTEESFCFPLYFYKFILTKLSRNSKINQKYNNDYDERNRQGDFKEREGRWKPLMLAGNVSLLSSAAPEKVAVQSALRI